MASEDLIFTFALQKWQRNKRRFFALSWNISPQNRHFFCVPTSMFYSITYVEACSMLLQILLVYTIAFLRIANCANISQSEVRRLAGTRALQSSFDRRHFLPWLPSSSISSSSNSFWQFTIPLCCFLCLSIIFSLWKNLHFVPTVKKGMSAISAISQVCKNSSF